MFTAIALEQLLPVFSTTSRYLPSIRIPFAQNDPNWRQSQTSNIFEIFQIFKVSSWRPCGSIHLYQRAGSETLDPKGLTSEALTSHYKLPWWCRDGSLLEVSVLLSPYLLQGFSIIPLPSDLRKHMSCKHSPNLARLTRSPVQQ